MTARGEAVLTAAIDALSLPANARVLVAVSGGADSVALAIAFHAVSLRSENEWLVRLAHVNHGLRGSESDADETLVRALAARLKLELDVVRVDTAAYAAQQRESIETAARELRYGALRHMLRTWGGDLIAVGHHRNDQAETVLMNLMRGAGLDGLSGMSPHTNDIIRPFLWLSRDEIESAMRDLSAESRIDSSNADLGPRRNYLRHRVLPVMREVRPDIERAIAGSASLLRDDAEYLNAETARIVEYLDLRPGPSGVSAALGAWRTLHLAVQTRALRVLVGRLKGDTRDITHEHVLLMRATIMSDDRPHRLADQLPHGLRLRRGNGRFEIALDEPEIKPAFGEAHLCIPGQLDTPLGRLEATIVPPGSPEHLARLVTVCGPSHALCDADVLGDRLLVRSRRPGDRIRPVGTAGSRKLQDLLVDAKIPRRERDQLPVIEHGEFIVWVPGFGVDRRASLRPETRRVAHLRFRPFI